MRFGAASIRRPRDISILGGRCLTIVVHPGPLAFALLVNIVQEHTFSFSVWHRNILGFICSFALLELTLLCLPIFHLHVAVRQGCIVNRLWGPKLSQDWPVCLFNHTNLAEALPGRCYYALISV